MKSGKLLQMTMDYRNYQLGRAKKEKVAERLKNSLETEKHIKFAFLFGSFVNAGEDETLPFRDIDVGVYTSGLDKTGAFHYSLDLADRLSSEVKLPVDVRVLNFAPLTFLFHVIRGQLLVDNDEDRRCEFMEWVTRHYLDMKPLYLRALKEAYASPAGE